MAIKGDYDHERILGELRKAVEDVPNLVTVTKAAELLAMSRGSIYRLIERGDLVAIRPELNGSMGHIRIPKSSVLNLYNKWFATSHA